MIRRAFLRFALVAALTAFAAPLSAGEPSSSVEMSPMDLASSPDGGASVEERLYFAHSELVSTATKREVKLEEAPANVTIITHEDIMQSGVQNLGEVFRRLAGMDVVQVSTSETDVSARGFAYPMVAGNKMAVLVDGRTFYLDFIGNVIWPQIPVPLEDIKRIEVIKGPMSSLYGNRAMLGIINVVTNDPEETRTRLSGGGGTQTYGEANFTNAGAFDDAKRYWYKVAGTFHRENVLSDYPGMTEKKDSQDFSVQGRFVAKPQEATRFELTGGVTKCFGTYDIVGLSHWTDTRTLIDGRASHDFGDGGKLDFQTSWQRNYLGGQALNFNIVMDEVDAELRHSIGVDITERVHNTTTYGFNYRMVGGNNPGVQTINDYAGFLQNETRFYDLVLLTGGVRVDNQHNFAGTNVSAQGSLVFLIHPRYTLRISGSTAFNAPTTLYYFTSAIPIPLPNVTLTDNLGLKAERIVYFEVGNTITPIDELRLRADFFYYRLNDLFAFQQTLLPPATVQYSVVNDGGARAVGGELSVEGDLTRWLIGYANASYQNFAPISGNIETTDNLSNPKYKANAGLRGSWLGGRLTANLDFHYIRKHEAQFAVITLSSMPAVEIGDSYLLNARVAGWPVKDHLEIAVMANNILNDNTPQTPSVDPALGVALAEKPHFGLWGSLRYIF